ncbi:sugar phosphate isomerase/epimerase family protein [Natronobacterium texcoconense]|nr:sugar phosphate isomerase/epimerase [Natronobacterium texcoconense]
MPKIGINLYSVRTLEEPLESVLDRVAEAGYDGVQFAGPYTPLEGDAAEIAAELESRGLEAAPPHVGIDALRDEDERERILAAYDEIGVDGVVVPWLPPDRFESAAAIDDAAAELEELATVLSATGLELHYHNHDHEYTEIDGEWAFDRLLEGTGIGIELDVGWALAGGDDPAARIRDHGARANQVHLKDLELDAEPGFVEIGAGDVDVSACVEAAEAAAVEWLVYEHDDPDDPAAAIDRGAAFLRSS